ncbi:hypothetical protein H2198_002093 [Neophaeococcomyces mojaviensis]|uniref:Uncharacterized protein n=1 Tax=Neophaeococcomyces mojaviensis TaxID=3383035 RepID=A0ACC3AF08_9EURO|nr:hypothetical protein H2198_002093 [Knufia sp. JES_112]
MHIPLWTALLHAAQYNGPSLVQRTNSANICLPYQLQTAVPSCALSCLQSFISNNYHNHDCSSTANLNLLCTTKTSSGLTIGEGSLQCVISNCLGADLETQSGYTICESVSGALPNMAGTITATISVFSTLTPSANASPSASTTPITNEAGSTTSALISSAPSSSTRPIIPITSSASPTSSLSSTSITSTTETFSTTSSIATTTSESSLSTSSNISETSSPTGAASTTERPTSVATSPVSSSSTGSATAAAATEAPTKQQLSTSGIAGIATACVVVAALLIGYLAYWLYVKRREQNIRRSQRFSTFFPPHTRNDSSGPPAEPALTGTTQAGSLLTPNKRFYSGEPDEQKRRSFWRRSFVPASSDIGVAVAPSASLLPRNRDDRTASETKRPLWPYPVSPLSQNHEKRFDKAQQTEGYRWSIATSFDEDVEAQNQDLPVLASPRTRSSSRSFSSVGIEKPLPLKLKVTKRANTPPSTRIPLTPTYDNGNYEPTIRQVIEEANQPSAIVRRSKEQQSLNFSRRAPLLRKSQEEPGPFTIQSQQRPSGTRFPVRPSLAARKESTATDISIHTEIEEDSTPEQEEDKQLTGAPKYSGTSRPPLRDLQWPQVPRSAATKKQAEKVPSPRAVLTIRTMSSDPAPSQPAFTRHSQVSGKDRRSTRTNASSTDSCSESSVLPVFPTPPARHPARNYNQVRLARQIADSYKAASQSTTTTTPTKASQQMAQLPQNRAQAIQRLGTGRPLAQKLQAQGYVPRPQLARSTSRARITPMTSRSGDLYLAVGEMEH